MAAILLGISTFAAVWLLIGNLGGSWDLLLAGLIPSVVGGWGIGLGIGMTAEALTAKSKAMGRASATLYSICIVLLGCSLSLGMTVGFQSRWLSGLLLVIGLIVMSMALNAPLNYAKQVADFRHTERDRIQP
jgi:hypothetical protein